MFLWNDMMHGYGDSYTFIEEEKTNSCEDTISRQEVLDQTYLWSKDEFLRVTNPFDYLRKRISSLPSVTPKVKGGHWFIDERPGSNKETICSNCEQPIFKYHKLDFDYRPKYCPNCGAKMKSEEN